MEQSYTTNILPARRAQWLVSAMSYAYGLSQPSQNEVVVLATGLDQYLQELFHHLDFAGDECITKGNFMNLLQILGLRNCYADDAYDQDASNGTMDFKEFHRQLVQSFLEDNGEDGFKEGKEWTFEGELVEAEVHMASRQGHSVRTMCSECFSQKPVSEVFHSVLYKQGKLLDNDKKVAATESEVQQAQTSQEIAKLQEENEGLRELVEDMRQALQSSDAKNLALEVTLRNLRSTDKPDATNLFEQIEATTKDNMVRSQSLTSMLLMNELNRLQDKRNVQLEEAMLYSQELEADLWRSRKDQETLQKTKATLLQNQQSIIVQLEKARRMLSEGLQKVKILEGQEYKVEELQLRLQEMQSSMPADARYVHM